MTQRCASIFMVIILTFRQSLSDINVVNDSSFLGVSTNSLVDYIYTEDTTQDSQNEVCGYEDICVRKCCPGGELLNLTDGCVPEDSLSNGQVVPFQQKNAKSRYRVVYGFPPKWNSSSDIICPMVAKDEFYVEEKSGKIFHKERKETFSQEYYCIDHIKDEYGEVKEFATICLLPIMKSSFDVWADVIQKIGLIISSLSLAAILSLYAACPGKKSLQLQSKCIVSSCVNLLIVYVLLVVNMTELVTQNISHIMCVVLGIAIQFFFLSFYFWLNVMIYDITRIIRGTTMMQVLSSLERKKLRYLCYASYSWGCPAVISSVTAIMQSLPTDLGLSKYQSDLVIRPHIGEGRCWFKEDGGSIYAYFYGIEVFLHLVNATLVIYSLFLLKGGELKRRLTRTKNENQPYNMRNHSKKNHLNLFWQQFFTYIMYLFVWILNSISLIHSQNQIWRLIDITVSLQGLFLLVIVVKFGNFKLKNTYERISVLVKTFSLTSSTSSSTGSKGGSGQSTEQTDAHNPL